MDDSVGPDYYISITIRHTAIKLGTHIHDPQKIYLEDFSGRLTLSVTPS